MFTKTKTDNSPSFRIDYLSERYNEALLKQSELTGI